MENLNELRDQIYNNAVYHGFHDNDLSREHFLCLVISELMEAVEADRKEKWANVEAFNRWNENFQCVDVGMRTRCFIQDFEAFIKDSVEDEMADAFIRLLDICGLYETPIEVDEGMVHNAITDMKQIGADTFTEQMYYIVRHIVLDQYAYSELRAIHNLLAVSKTLGIDIILFVKRKMEYNKHRGYKHGKAY